MQSIINSPIITTFARQQAEAFGLSEAQLLDIAKHTAKYTHEHGNRRYHSYLLDIQANTIVSIYDINTVDRELAACKSCLDIGKVLTYTECSLCDGKGCHQCDKGLVPQTIACQYCGVKQHTQWTHKHI